MQVQSEGNAQQIVPGQPSLGSAESQEQIKKLALQSQVGLDSKNTLWFTFASSIWTVCNEAREVMEKKWKKDACARGLGVRELRFVTANTLNSPSLFIDMQQDLLVMESESNCCFLV